MSRDTIPSGGFSVALLGPDGSGKSTISHHLQETWPAPVRVIYMGVSPESSNVMLPTTWLIRRLRQRDGEQPSPPPTPPGSTTRRAGPVAALREWLRILNLIADEWFRQGVAWYHMRRGRLVVFDRHYLADYYFHHIAPPNGHIPSLAARVHGWQLERLFPRPDLVIALDAPTRELTARKQEDSVAWLDQRRTEYSALPELFPRLVTLDVDAPLPTVLSSVSELITTYAGERSRRRP